MLVNNAKYVFSSMNISKFYYTGITPKVVLNLIVRDPILTRDIMIAGTKYISIWVITIFFKKE